MPKIGDTYVPNIGPEDSKLLLVGEAPGGQEEIDQEPFVGDAGEKLTKVLGRNAISRSQVRLCNLSNYRPFPNNEFVHLLDTPQLERGLVNLRDSIRKHKPTVIGAMGNWPLYYLTGKQGKSPGTGITNWRGSALPCTLEGCEGVKVIPTFHPSYINRDRKKYPIFDMDMKFIIEESEFPEIKQPEENFIIDPQGDLLEITTKNFLNADYLDVDIETYGMDIACIGFAASKSDAVCFGLLGSSSVRGAVTRLLHSGIPLSFHFGTFDTIVLDLNGYEVDNWIQNYKWDTHTAQHVMWLELPRSLAFLNSVYSHPRRPYYKHERKGEAGDADSKSWNPKMTKKRTLMIYNCRDVCSTQESRVIQQEKIENGPESWTRFFEFEMEQIRGPARALSVAGFYVDMERKSMLSKAVTYKWAVAQTDLNKIVGLQLNVNSPPQVQALLYRVFKLPIKKNRVPGKAEAVTADDDALVSLLNYTKSKSDSVIKSATKAKWNRMHLVIKLIRIIRRLRKRLSSYIDISISLDMRLRSIW